VSAEGRLAPAPAEAGLTYSPAIRSALRYHRWVFRTLATFVKGSVLEVGSGHGIYTRWLREAGHPVVVSDIDSAACTRLREDFRGDPDVSVVCMDGIDPARVPRAIETVFAVNVLEHLADDAGFLRAAAALVAPSRAGRVVLFVPAGPALYGPLDRLAGHHRRYTLASLRGALERAGLVPERLHPFNGLGGLGWWLSAQVSRPADLASEGIAWQIRLADRLVPVFRAVDPLFRTLGFGQSLVAVAKPRSDTCAV
jgi:SAM-dependent methyltransferase